MRLSIVIFQIVRFLLPPAVIFTAYLYLYPAVHGCGFPLPTRTDADRAACFLDGRQGAGAPPTSTTVREPAPFRLLALGDPQLEGDTSLPDPNVPSFPSLYTFREQLSTAGLAQWPRYITNAFLNFWVHDISKLIGGYRKRLDLWGNDYYLAHVYRSVRWWTDPTHTVVLGDLLGSQWIDDGEFASRSDRFWKRVFTGMRRVPDRIAGLGELDEKDEMFLHGKLEALNDTGVSRWKDWLINVAGNHDIGYAGDINQGRIDRFEKNFGKVNWETRMQLSSADDSVTAAPSPFGTDTNPPKLRLVVLNSMNIDSPVWDQSAQEETYRFLGRQMERAMRQRPQDATVLLTHVPLYKSGGVCADGPFFTYFPAEMGGGVMEQNHMSEGASEFVLDGLFGQGRQGVILNGHDHEGCDVYHYQHPEEDVPDTNNSPATIGNWSTTHYRSARKHVLDNQTHGIREITVRSMMGSYGGNAGLLSGWFDAELGRWRFEYDTCMLGVQHIWWAVHILDLIVILLALALLPVALVDARLDRLEEERRLKSIDKSSEKKRQ